MSYQHDLSLFENASNSLWHGLAILFDGNKAESDIKQAIMNLVNVIDLLILEKEKKKVENLIL